MYEQQAYNVKLFCFILIEIQIYLFEFLLEPGLKKNLIWSYLGRFPILLFLQLMIKVMSLRYKFNIIAIFFTLAI